MKKEKQKNRKGTMIMNKKTILSLLLLLPTLGAAAQDMKAMWLTMPEEIAPYLKESMRKEMAEFLNLGVRGDVKNAFNETSELDTLSADYLRATLSQSTRIEMQLLPLDGGVGWTDSVACLVTTILTPEPMSSVRFFDREWRELPAGQFVESPTSVDLCLYRPEGMEEERFREIRALLELEMVGIKLVPEEQRLEIRPSAPLTTKEDRESLETIIKQRNLKWNGKTFK